MVVFYSRKPEQSKAIQAFCDSRGFQLLAEPFIAFESVAFTTENLEHEIVFFTSPRSFDFYVSQEKINEDIALACIGHSTQKHVESFGYITAFVGSQSNKPKVVAEEFKSWLGQRKVLFPISNISNQTIQAVLPNNQFHEIVVYKTLLLDKKLDLQPDVLIFTSPSNAKAYLKNQEIDSQKKVACFGQTTGDFLISKKITHTTLETTDEAGVIKYLEQL